MEECKKTLSTIECKKEMMKRLLSVCSRLFHTCPKKVQQTEVR
jgi:hypothetical protein